MSLLKPAWVRLTLSVPRPDNWWGRRIKSVPYYGYVGIPLSYHVPLAVGVGLNQHIRPSRLYNSLGTSARICFTADPLGVLFHSLFHSWSFESSSWQIKEKLCFIVALLITNSFFIFKFKLLIRKSYNSLWGIILIN